MTATTPLAVGAMIDTRYRVLGVLGCGLNGAVYEVEDENQGLRGALKFITEVASDTWDEARYLTQLDGEHILRVHNAADALGAPYIVTAVARHGSLLDQISNDIGVPLNQAARWIQQTAWGLQRVHDIGLLHLDIKPANIFVDDIGGALLGDLGSASLMDSSGRGRFGGTPKTMAPEIAKVGASVPRCELFQHQPTTVASDIYSLGATLYWLIAGRPPHNGSEGQVAIMQAVASAAPPRIATVAPHCPPGLVRIVERAMSRNSTDRYNSAAEFAGALGGRSIQPRQWTRIVRHPGHIDCYVGERKSRPAIAVCAAPAVADRRVEITSRYLKSGKAVPSASREVAAGKVPATVRALIRSLD